MHITIETVELQKALESVTRISTKHITLPILQCVLLTASKKTLSLKATNLEIGIEATINTQTDTEGVVAVPAQILLQIVNLITQKTTTLYTEENVLIIETNSSKTEIKSVAPEDFPTIQKIDTNAITIKGSLFALGIKTTAFTASQSSIKPELGSVYVFQKKEHSLTFVATDSFRLMEKTVPQQGLVLTESILIPYKNALELARIAEQSDGDIKLYITENQCALQVGTIYITSRLVSGTFPDYEQIIPKEYVTHATTLTNDFMHTLKKTNIFLNKFMQVSFTVSQKSITLSSQSSEFGATTESIHATTEGDDLTLNFNQRYIADVIPHINDDSMTFHFAGIGRPVVIENLHDRTLRYLVMPMNK